MSKMFTIEQAGSIKKVNTINELIIEYIRKYSCQGGVGSGPNINVEEIKKMLEPYALSTDLFEFLKTEEFNKEILNYVSNKELENEYRKKDDLIYEDTTLLTTAVADEKYRLKDDIPTVVNSLLYDESSTTNDVAIPTVKLVEELTKDNLFKYDEAKNEIVMANTDNNKCVSLESNYGRPALKITNYASAYNEVSFGATHYGFLISDINNNVILSYDKDDKRTSLVNPCNYKDQKPLLTEVTADERYNRKNCILTIKAMFEDGISTSFSIIHNVNANDKKVYVKIEDIAEYVSGYVAYESDKVGYIKCSVESETTILFVKTITENVFTYGDYTS